MSTERQSGEVHVTKGEAAYAAICGALLGSGILFPPLGGIGLAAGAIGAIRVHGRESFEAGKLTARAIENGMRRRKPTPEELDRRVLSFFDEPGVVRGSIDEGPISPSSQVGSNGS